MKLKDIFKMVAIKRLSAVEIDASVSHQHELNGVRDLSAIFGLSGEKKRFPAKFLYLNDDSLLSEPKLIMEDGSVTWYDARANHPKRTEYRLYYSSSLLYEYAGEGDFLITGFDGKQVWFIIVENESEIAAQLLWLFDFDAEEIQAKRFRISDYQYDTHSLNVIEQLILEQLGFETDLSNDIDFDALLSRFSGKFPSTAEFSEYAREVSGVSSSMDHPDEVLLVWWAKEEQLFRALEKSIVEEQLKIGFDDVDHFISFAKSVLNRRNSRAGHAFENHIATILQEHNIIFDKGKLTEYKSKPDFLFPSAEIYQKVAASEAMQKNLTMLAAKTSCKDRWRQITKEAKLIFPKHLITLEAAISIDQTDEMHRNGVHLIVPAEIQSSYKPAQQKWLMCFEDFIALVRERQKYFHMK